MNKHLIAAGALTLAVAGASTGVVSAQATLPELEFDVTPNAVKVAPGTTQIGAGFHRITLDRRGKGETGLALVRLNAGVTPEEFGKQIPKIKSPDEAAKYGRFAASTFLAGKTSYTTTIKLDDADYAFVDFTNKPAVRLTFHAGPAPDDGGAHLPPVDANVNLMDYRFAMPSTLKAGKTTLRVANRGNVLHHALVFPLAKGVDTAKLLKKIKAGKEPRSEFAGPPSALVEMVSPRFTNDVEVNLHKGKYLFVCFLQNSPKAKMHAQLGMQKVVTVR
jgi:hypothetical protein